MDGFFRFLLARIQTGFRREARRGRRGGQVSPGPRVFQVRVGR